MDDVNKRKAKAREYAGRRRAITASIGQKRLAFQIGRRRGLLFGGAPRRRDGTNLLISNVLGVWSLRRRRYVKKTRFHRFHSLRARARAGLVAKRYASLRELGMLSWPEYAAERRRVELWRARLADAYWRAAPGWYRERAAAFLCEARRDARRWLLVFWLCAAMQAAQCLFIAKVAWSAVLPARTMFLYIVFGFLLHYKPVGNMWRDTFRRPDVSVRMLEVV